MQKPGSETFMEKIIKPAESDFFIHRWIALILGISVGLRLLNISVVKVVFTAASVSLIYFAWGAVSMQVLNNNPNLAETNWRNRTELQRYYTILFGFNLLILLLMGIAWIALNNLKTNPGNPWSQQLTGVIIERSISAVIDSLLELL